MDYLFSTLNFLIFGFFGLLAILIVVALIFGKRIVKKWEYEAEFKDERGREFGEFDVEMSQIAKIDPDFTLKAKFRMHHTSLGLHQAVQVYLDDVLVLEGMVEKEGSVYLDNKNLQTEIDEPRVGQSCRVVCGGTEEFVAQLEPD
jgi:histidyl-tRNA synthetase